MRGFQPGAFQHPGFQMDAGLVVPVKWAGLLRPVPRERLLSDITEDEALAIAGTLGMEPAALLALLAAAEKRRS